MVQIHIILGLEPFGEKGNWEEKDLDVEKGVRPGRRSRFRCARGPHASGLKARSSAALAVEQIKLRIIGFKDLSDGKY
jgi:hypothetical protein